MAKANSKVLEVISLLKKHYPDAHCALNHETPFQLLIATMLSAQCTDERVNQVTPNLFKKYPDAKKMAKAKIPDLEKLVRSTGFFKNKAKNIKACSEILVEQYKGEVPKTMEELDALPGVARKTANVVLGEAFGIASGIVIDTHGIRLSNKLGLVNTEDPVKIEAELMKLLPKEYWINFGQLLHLDARGREILWGKFLREIARVEQLQGFFTLSVRD